MSSRRASQFKPYFKRRTKQAPGYSRQFAYTEVNGEMIKALDPDGNEIFRDVPNRALKRKVASEMKVKK